MSFEITKQEIRTGKKLYEVSDGQRIEPEIVLPDYCKEIKKLLRCSFVPGVHSVSLSGEKVTAKGTGVIRVLYIGEGDALDVFEKNCDLVSSVQMKDVPQDAVLTAKRAVDFLNCRVTGQRKLSVSIGISTVFTCYCTESRRMIAKPESKSIQTKTEKINCETFSGFYEKTFDLSETLVFNPEHPSADKIVSADGFCSLESSKISSGKLLIKGEATIKVCYLTENQENKFHTVSHSMPISQIVDLGDSAEGKTPDINLRLNQLSYTLKADSSGKNRLVELALRVSALVSLAQKKELEVVTDCYCTSYDIDAEYEKSDALCPLREVNEALQHKGEIEFSDKVKEILSARCLEINKSIAYTQEKADFSCSALIGIIYIDENGVPAYCEKNTDFSFYYSITRKCSEPFGFFEIEADGISVELSGNQKAEISLDYRVRGRIYCHFEKEILKKLTVHEDKVKNEKGAALTLYFAEKGERLWDIARAHNTTIELIAEENGLDASDTTEQTLLLIPCV